MTYSTSPAWGSSELLWVHRDSVGREGTKTYFFKNKGKNKKDCIFSGILGWISGILTSYSDLRHGEGWKVFFWDIRPSEATVFITDDRQPWWRPTALGSTKEDGREKKKRKIVFFFKYKAQMKFSDFFFCLYRGMKWRRFGLSSWASKQCCFGLTCEPNLDSLKTCVFWEWGANCPFGPSVFFIYFNLSYLFCFIWFLVL